MPKSQKIFYVTSLPLLAVLFVAAIYGHAIHAPFVFDDYLTIVDNPAIKDLTNIRWIWAIDPSRFLTYLSFAVNYALGGLRVEGYHWVNFFLHVLTGGVVYLFVRLVFSRLLRNFFSVSEIHQLTAVSAFLFLCHPIQTQAVIYVSERSTLFAAFFYLTTLVLYSQSVLKSHRGYYCLSLLSAFVGVFAKPTIITLPLAVCLCEIFLFDLTKSRLKKRIPYVLPFFLIIVIVPLLLILWKHKSLALGHVFDITRETTKITRPEYLLSQFNVMMTYFRLLVYPVNQNLDYDYPLAKDFFSFPTYFSSGALIVILILAFKYFKSQRIISFGLFWFFLTLSLESSIFPISDVIFEHRLYLPIVGIVMIVSVVFKRLFRRQNTYLIIMGVVMAILTMTGYQRAGVWTDKIKFLQDIVKKSPNKPRTHNNLASAYHDLGRLKEAEQEYKKAIALNQNYAHPHNNLSNLYFIGGDIAQAVEELEIAIRLDARYEAPHYNLGNIYLEQGDLEKAEQCYRRALSIKPTLAFAHIGLGTLYHRKKEAAFAEAHFRESIKLNPDLAFAYYGLGDVFLSEARFDLALAQYQKAIEKNPGMVSAYNNIANILDMNGQYHEAVAFYKKAISINPSFANAYFNLSHTLKKMGRQKESVRFLDTARGLYKNQKNEKMSGLAEKRLQGLYR